MNLPADLMDRVRATRRRLLDELLAMQEPGGWWTGELSSSALSTATSVAAFCQLRAAGQGGFDDLIDAGVTWIESNANEDGGWGDTVRSKSNISTTMLCRAALKIAGRAVPAAADAWVTNATRDFPDEAEAIKARYGKDRTFSVPILMMCAMAGDVPWSAIPRLPFELAVLPHRFYAAVRLPVVSYALPALIAIGQLLHAKNPSRVPPLRWTRSLSVERTLRKLKTLQPSNGGFLEAAPLTGFVTMALAAAGRADHVVAKKGAAFLAESMRPDGSWPIDTNLATWVTTLIVNALGDSARSELPDPGATLRWLLDQQYQEVHPFTNAAPGGWAWTPLPGGVPDADDTSGAVRAVAFLRDEGRGTRGERDKESSDRLAANASERSRERSGTASHDKTSPSPNADERTDAQRSPAFAAKRRGVRVAECDAAIERGLLWLASLQNRDGGVPTFCRGWGTLPFDRSSNDITAHAILAEHNETLCEDLRGVDSAITEQLAAIPERGANFLRRRQRTDGSWLPLWFGNQGVVGDENPVYGTSRVLQMFGTDLPSFPDDRQLSKSVDWLAAQQNPDGGFGGAAGVPSTVEETGVAVEALIACGSDAAAARGLAYLCDAIDRGDHRTPQPIGFYFAKLWYFERLYPYAFALGALQAAVDAGEQGT